MLLLTATNLYSVSSFGEFEFWFASIKVAAIIVFIAIAAGFLLGIGSGASPGLSNLTAHGGFAPNGALTILSGVVDRRLRVRRRGDRHDRGGRVRGARAGGRARPRTRWSRACSSFYVLAVFLMVCIVPWNSTKLGESPFAAALDTIGIPGAADIMNAIVVTAVLSCLNSGIYVAVADALRARPPRRRARRRLLDVNARGVPVKAILLSVSMGFVSVIFNAISPDKVFLFLVNASGAVALFVYLLICVAAAADAPAPRGRGAGAAEAEDVAVPLPDLRDDGRDGGRDRVRRPGEGHALAADPEPDLARGRARRRLDREPPAERRPRARRGRGAGHQGLKANAPVGKPGRSSGGPSLGGAALWGTSIFGASRPRR